MKTNFEMVRELEAIYTPKERGICNGKEVEMIENTLCLSSMDIIGLRNMRDFVVLFYSRKETMEAWDKMSAITSVIDNKIFIKGGEV
jgi:hypothetical protein